MRIRIGVVGIAVVAAIAAFAPGAQASVTLGSSLSAVPDDGVFCPQTCSFVQMELPGRAVAAPANGVIVSWRIRTDGPGGPFNLRVMRPVSGTTVTGVSASRAEGPGAAGVSEFATRLRVQQGDRIGLDFRGSGGAKFKNGGPGVPGALALYYDPFLKDGESLSATISNEDTELLFNAEFEPDVDGDGYGDESQDICPAFAGPRQGCVSSSPALVRSEPKKQRLKKLSAIATLDRVCAVTTHAVVEYKIGKKRIRFKSKVASAMVGPGATTKFPLAFTKSQRSKMTARLKLKKKLTAVITYRAEDAFGQFSRATSRVRLKL